MPDSTTEWRATRPTEGFSTAHLPAFPGRPARLFVPDDYQPKYAYPLVVLFHAAGADEDAAVRLAPRLSRRNYIIVCPRGSSPLKAGRTGRPGFGWTEDSPDSYLARLVAHVREGHHIHAERLYLIGIGEGVAAATRFAMSLPKPVAGLIAMNGTLPTQFSGTAFQGTRVFVGHGASHPTVPLVGARKAARFLVGAGAAVRFQSYPTHRVTDDMLRDVNRWIMDGVNSDIDPLLEPHG